MITKTLLDKVLSNIKSGGLLVEYWDGKSVKYGPAKPYLKLIIKRPKAVRAIVKNMTLGFGESYMRGDIDVEGPLDQIGRLVAENQSAFKKLAVNRVTKPRQANTKRSQARQVQHHYDLGNDFYKLWLDKSMTYSCAYFKKPSDSLEKAQEQKVGHILRKLQLSKGQKLLDIGCGWGQLIFAAAENYGVRGHGITLSKQQLSHCKAEAKRRKLGKLVKFELLNYQDLAMRKVSYDRIVSVGMFEHVGRNNHRSYYQAVKKMLIPGGISVLHTISNQVETTNDPWIDKYIFPGGYIPAIREVISALPEFDFHLTDYESLRLHYAMTLDEWLRRFEKSVKKVSSMYDERFVRMWRMYLSMSSSGFRYNDLDLSQIVFTKGLNNSLPLTREHLYK